MNPDGDRGQCVRSADPCTTVFGYLNTEKEPARYGNTHPSIVPYQLFNSIDGHIAVGNDEQFRRFCRVIGDRPLWPMSRALWPTRAAPSTGRSCCPFWRNTGREAVAGVPGAGGRRHAARRSFQLDPGKPKRRYPGGAMPILHRRDRLDWYRARAPAAACCRAWPRTPLDGHAGMRDRTMAINCFPACRCWP